LDHCLSQVDADPAPEMADRVSNRSLGGQSLARDRQYFAILAFYPGDPVRASPDKLVATVTRACPC